MCGASFTRKSSDSPPTLPQAIDPAIIEARMKQRRRLAASSGRASTILTSPQGEITAPLLGAPVLLGGSRV